MRRLIGNTALAIMLVCLIMLSSMNFVAMASSGAKPLNSGQDPDYYFTITGYPVSATAGQSFDGVTVTAYYSNGTLYSSYSGQVYFTSSDSLATMPYTPQTTYTFTTGASGDNGAHTFSGFNLVTAGSQTITVTDGSVSVTSSQITVGPSYPVQIQISPMTATITAGSKQAYVDTATDSFGNSWDVSTSTLWGITPAAKGSWSGSIYTSQKAGSWTVVASCDGMLAFASLIVNPAAALSITISPKISSITAGHAQPFTASASDSYGNIWDVTSQTNWSISSSAGGSWTSNTYVSAKAGTWIITATYLGYSDTASLTVTHDAVASISISPVNPTYAAGSQVTFTAAASDIYGNSWDVTSSTSWSITAAAGGSWSGNVYSCAKAGIWTVTGNCSSLIGSTTLTVSYANVYSITISPKISSLTAGSWEAFTATASDIYGNSWDATNSTSWTLTSGAVGSWVGNTYLAEYAGVWTVTGTYMGITDTANLTVTPSSPAMIIIGSSTSSAVAGSQVNFTATAFDLFGNSWDVSSQTHWIIDSGAQGSWAGNIYTAAKAGTWTVTGGYDNFYDTTTLTVTPGQPISITLSPKTVSLTAGFTQAYTATATDSFANTWDVSAQTTWAIDALAGGSWTSSVYGSAKAGTWTVTGTYMGLSDTSSLTVNHSYAVSIQVNPGTSTITAGSKQTFTTTAFDHYGNSWDSTSSATFTIDEAAGGSLNANVYTSAKAGMWTVMATSLELTGTASLTVTHSSPIAVSLSPSSETINAGTSQAYTASASDTYGNTWDVTGQTSWIISSGAGGNWTNNVYKSASAGNWTITGTYSGLSNVAYLTVNHDSAVSLSVSPKSTTITTGSNEAYTVQAYDAFNNTWDATSSADWVTDSGAGGSWLNNVYFSVYAGTWTVTCVVDNITATALLTVNHGTPLSITVSPASTQLIAGQFQTFTAKSYDSNGNSWDVSSSTSWTIDAGAGGSWSGNVYTSNTAGNWVVTATYLGLTSTATITVTHASAGHITVGASSNSIVAGSSVTLTAAASDVYGNVWDVTTSTVWSIQAGAGGSLSGDTYTSEFAGVWNLTGVFSHLSQSVFLTVNHASPVSIVITPANANVTAGSNEAYSAMAFDVFDNSWDVTISTGWSITSAAGGFWSNNIYTPARAGTWTITATFSNLSATTTIIALHSSPTNILIAPTNQTITAGNQLVFAATTQDAYGNSWDVSNSTIWIIDSGAQGSWINDVYASAKAGTWKVTGVFDNLDSSTFITVNHGPISAISVTPATATINMGATQTYLATANDNFANTWDVTPIVAWSINASAGGQWNGNIYTSTNSGNWIITASSGNVSGQAGLTVNSIVYSPDDFAHAGVVNFFDVQFFYLAYKTYASTHYCTTSCDFNHDGKINFQDLCWFAIYYIAATKNQ